MTQRRSNRQLIVVFGIVIVFVVGCGSAPAILSSPQSGVPSATASIGSSPSSAPTPSAGIPAITLVELAEADDPSAAARHELQLTTEIRDDAGMPALIGENGTSAFSALDEMLDTFGQEVIAEIAATIDAGQIPTDAGEGTSDRPARMLASVGGAPDAMKPAFQQIDINLFADTGFTGSALMSMYTQLVQRAAESQSGTVSRQDTTQSDSNGLRQHVDMGITFTIQTGGGRVSADLVMTATDNITDAATGSFVALYTSRTTGHFDVNACPDENGVGEGTYTFETTHELNDVSTTTASRSGAGRAVDAPFRLIDGDNAFLQQIEATLDLTADAFGPGTPSGPGPTGPFDWDAAQQVQIVMPAGGSTTATGGGVTVTGTGGERAGGAMFLSSAMAQLFLGQVGKEAEKFWRSGECVEVRTSEESGEVEPQEELPVTVEAVHRFDGAPVEGPAEMTFTGVKEIRPTDPIDTPGEFTFVAGENRGDEGTVEIKHTSKRGIGTKSLTFTVGGGYRISMDGHMSIDAANSSEITVSEVELIAQDDGTYTVETDAVYTGTVGFPGCTENYTRSLPIRITVRPEADSEPPTANLRVEAVSSGELEGVPITCQGATTLAPVPLFLWPLSFNTSTAPGVTVVVNEPTTVIGESAAGAGARIDTVVNLTSE